MEGEDGYSNNFMYKNPPYGLAPNSQGTVIDKRIKITRTRDFELDLIQMKLTSRQVLTDVNCTISFLVPCRLIKVSLKTEFAVKYLSC